MTAHNSSVISLDHPLNRGGFPMPSDSDIAIQIERILASRWFLRSERLHRFVRFSASYALGDGADRLKEYLVGIEVFDRGPNYDPRIDPIVRVEARRLRAKLKAYYASAGREDQLRIEFPKGSYSPVFRLRPTRQSKLKLATHAAIAVLPFFNFTNSASNESFCEGLTEELIHRLAQVPGLQVVLDHRAARGAEFGERLGLPRGVTNWNLRGSIRGSEGNVRIIAQLIETSSGAYVWSETYEPAIGDTLSVQDNIAKAILARFQSTFAPSRIASKAG